METLAVRPTFEQGGYRLPDFADLPIDLPATVDEDLSTKPTVQADLRRFFATAMGHVRTRERQLRYARFYAYLHTQVDRQIGKLLDALDANGLTDDTVVIRTSDHGELGMAHGRLRQKFYNAYRETLSVPLIVSNPRLFAEARSTDALAGLVDVLPTLATIGAVPEPERYGLAGRDLSPVLADPRATVQDVLHFAYEDDVFPVKGATFLRALVENAWKYAVYYDAYTGAPPEYELYDLARDPLETTNLAHAASVTPAAEAQRARLHLRLTEVMRRCGTTPDEIRWPEVGEYRPPTALAETREEDVVTA
jgi:arylsulfatase A-like enzyme